MNLRPFQQEQGGAPLDRRYSLARMFVNNTQLAQPQIAGRADVVTSTGAIGTYALNFAPVTFVAAPVVVAWCSKESGGNPVLISLDAVTAAYFQFDMIIPASSAAVNAGHTVTVEWIAVGA